MVQCVSYKGYAEIYILYYMFKATDPSLFNVIIVP
jgi:hypothetical protein